MTLKDFNQISNPKFNNKLSVIMMADSFFYAIFDDEDKIILHQSYEDLRYSNPFSLQSILNDDIFKSDFYKTTIMVVEEFDYLTSTENNSLGNFFPGLEHKEVYREQLIENHLYNYFGISSHQETLIQTLFHQSNFTIRSYSSALYHWYKFNEEAIIHLHFEHSSFIIYIQKDNNIRLSNYFKINEVNDVLYFVLATCKENQIDLFNDNFKVSGNIEQDSPVFSTLKAYVSKISLVNLDNIFSDMEIQQSAFSHHYFFHYINVI